MFPPPNSSARTNYSHIGRYKPQHSRTFSSAQEQVILGGLLGDFCLWRKNGARNAILIANHSYKQAEYVQYKYSILKDFVRSPPRLAKNGGWGSWNIYFHTVSHPRLTQIYEFTYPNGKKTITMDWLERMTSPLALAIWFMDDGSNSKSTAAIATHSFPLASCHLLQQWLCSRWGIGVTVVEDKRGTGCYLRLRVSEREKLFALIRPHVIPGMAYKVTIQRKRRIGRTPYRPVPRLARNCVICGQPFETSKPNQITCAPQCSHTRKIRVLRIYRVLYNPRRRFLRTISRMAGTILPRKCISCGITFLPPNNHRKTCGETCHEVLVQRSRKLYELGKLTASSMT